MFEKQGSDLGVLACYATEIEYNDSKRMILRGDTCQKDM
jgi:hypothetical protein